MLLRESCQQVFKNITGEKLWSVNARSRDESQHTREY